MDFRAGDFINPVIKDLPSSGIRKFFDIAASVKGVVSLGIGEPDFVTPQRVIDAAVASLKEGHTSYTSNAGMLELREAIAAYLQKDFGLHYNAENEVLITVGGSEAIDIALRAIVSPGDEILVVEPCFVSYKPCVTMAGGIPVPVTTYMKDNFKLTPEMLEEKITPKTKAVLMSFPSNPSGAILNREDLTAICEVIKKHNLLVISDEIYAHLTYCGKHVSVAEIPGMQERTVLVSGASKAFAMTGWRIGYLCANEELTQAMYKIHQYAIMCAPTISQYAALEAFLHGENETKRMVDAYNQRRILIYERLKDIGFDVCEPEGAFYIFPSIQKTGLNSEEFCNRLVQEYKAAVVPGNAFGACGEGFIRCSYSASIEKINIACDRMAEFVRPFMPKREI